MRRIILRAAKPGVTSAIALCFIRLSGPTCSHVLLGGGRVPHVGNLIASQFSEARNWPFGAALSTVILLITLLCGVAASIGAAKRRVTPAWRYEQNEVSAMTSSNKEIKHTGSNGYPHSAGTHDGETAPVVHMDYGTAAEFGAIVERTIGERGEHASAQMPQWLEDKQPDRALSTRRSGRNRLKTFPGVAFISVLVILFLYLPMLMVVMFSFNGGRQALLWKGSPSLVRHGVPRPGIISAALTSLEVAVIAMVLSTVIGVLFILAADQMSRAVRRSPAG